MMKKCLVFIGLLLITKLLAAQALPLVKPVPDLPFAHFESRNVEKINDTVSNLSRED